MGFHPESTPATFLFSRSGSGIIGVALAVPGPSSVRVTACATQACVRMRTGYKPGPALAPMKPLRLVSTPTRNRRLNEVLGLVLLVSAALLFLALATYTPTDPSANTVGGLRRRRALLRRACRSPGRRPCPQLDRPGRSVARRPHPPDHRHRRLLPAHRPGTAWPLLDAPASRRLRDGAPPRPRSVDRLRSGGHRPASAHPLLASRPAHRGRHRAPARRCHGAVPQPSRRLHRPRPDGPAVRLPGHHLHLPHRPRVDGDALLPAAQPLRPPAQLARPPRPGPRRKARPTAAHRPAPAGRLARTRPRAGAGPHAAARPHAGTQP